jgi:hypothetical protein
MQGSSTDHHGMYYQSQSDCVFLQVEQMPGSRCIFDGTLLPNGHIILTGGQKVRRAPSAKLCQIVSFILHKKLHIANFCCFYYFLSVTQWLALWLVFLCTQT